MSVRFPIIDRLLEGEDEDLRDELADILSSDTFTAEHVASTLRDAGHPISASTIRTYRRSLRQEGQGVA